ncbi:hypothetical protein VM94_02879 [Janthinobacterium sp. KBS0711]|nr:hypothetical protein VM94_02879 [Janthinobacterium sp. KBS0711]
MAFFSRDYDVFPLLAAPGAAPLWQAAQWTRIELTPHLS